MKLENLKKLVGIKSEVGDMLEKYREVYEVILVGNRIELQSYLTELFAEDYADTLLIAATDVTIAMGKQYVIATMAYMNPQIPGQTYAGVDMIVEGFEEVDGNFLEKVYQRYHHIPWKIAETKRTVIRELSLEDMDALFELYADGEICKYTEKLYPYEEEKEFQRAYIESMYRFYGYGMWLVFSKETGALIGRAGLEHREYHGNIELELGYLIGTKYQGQGYATEVCQMILKIAKSMTDFSQIHCFIEADNVVSMHLAEKLQFFRREDIEIDGKKMCRYSQSLI